MNKDIADIKCGILFVYNNNVLLVHNSGKNFGGNYSIPKGHINDGEKKKDCAIREVFEETGITIDKKRLGDRRSIKNNGVTLYYYIVEIKDLSEIGLKSTVIKSKKLQTKEIDWAGFIPIRRASTVINPSQIKIITDYINGNKSTKYIINYEKFVNKLS